MLKKISSPEMKVKFWRTLLNTIILLCICDFICTEVLYAQEKSILELKKDIQQSDQIIKSYENDLNQIKNERSSCERKISKLNNELLITNKKIETVQLQKKSLIEESQIIQTQLKAEQQRLQVLIKHMYMIGTNSGTKILLNNDDPNTNSRYLIYYSYLLNIKTELLNNIKSKQYKKNQKQLETEKQIKLKNEDKLKLTLSSEKKKIQQMQIALNKLQKEMEDNQQKIKTSRRIKNEQDIIQARKKALDEGKNQDIAEQEEKRRQQINTPHGLSELKGKLPWPLKGSIIRNFGQTRHGDITWKGLLLSAASKEKIVAIASGDVLYSGWLNGLGNIVVIDHGNNYISLYGNNYSILPKTGTQDGDRIFGSPRYVECDFFGSKAKFPLGPFVLAVQRNVPAIAIFVMKTSTMKYNIHIRQLIVDEPCADKKERVKKLAQKFASTVEEIIRIYPEQWFNYYEFWN